MKNLFSFVLGFILFLCPFAVQAEDFDLMPEEELAEAHGLDPITEEALNYLLGEDMSQGTLSWQGNKASTKFNYDMKKEKR